MEESVIGINIRQTFSFFRKILSKIFPMDFSVMRQC